MKQFSEKKLKLVAILAGLFLSLFVLMINLNILLFFSIESIKDKYLTFRFEYPFYFGLFDGYKNEIKYLLQYNDTLLQNVSSAGIELMG